jgi:hypothetical protein
MPLDIFKGFEAAMLIVNSQIFYKSGMLAVMHGEKPN